MYKKGQVAFFIILAIVIVLAILLVVFIRFDNEIKDPSKLNEEDRIIFDLQNCIDEQLETAVQIIGLQGGYVELPPDSLQTDIGPVAYGLKDGKNIVPGISKIEGEMNKYFELILPLCINEDNYLEINLDQDFRNIRTIIGNDMVSLEFDYSASLERAGSSETIREEIKGNLQVRLREMRNVAWDIANLHVRSPDFIDVTYLLDSEFDILFVPVEDSLLYSITDDESEINEVPFSYLLGVE